jgi:hypothetical protein
VSDQKLPDKLNTAAILQIVSGVLNVFFMAGVSYMVLGVGGGLITAMCTLGMCPFGVFCGFAAFLLVPIGIFEILSGVLILTNNPNALKIQRYVSIAQKVAILFGGIGSLIMSFVVDGMVNDPEVLAYLESQS